jgi:hypothetical protein
MYDRNPDELRRRARLIANSGKNARSTWEELKKWASGKGPAAMKGAMIEYLNFFGSSPESAAMLPEILRNASLLPSPQERREIFRLAKYKKHAIAEHQGLSMKSDMPVEKSRPSLSLTFNPAPPTDLPRLGAIAPLSPAADHSKIRDLHFSMRERMSVQIRDSWRAAAPVASPVFDPTKSPDTFVMGAHKGEHLVKSLIHTLRSHGSDEKHHVPHMHHETPAPRKTVKRRKRKPLAKKTGKKAVHKQEKRKSKGKPRRIAKRRRR